MINTGGRVRLSLILVVLLLFTSLIAQDNCWSKVIYSQHWSYGNSVCQTNDGNYVVAGVQYNEYGQDLLILKTDPNGNELWRQTYGNTYYGDAADYVQQTNDGGYLIIGTTYTASNHNDIILMKMTPDGSISWTETYGDDSYHERGLCVEQTSDNGYILCGSKVFSGADREWWIVKVNQSGTEIWTTTFGSDNWDSAIEIHQTNDGNYIVTGRWNNDKSMLMKIDANGNQIWAQLFDSCVIQSVEELSNGDFILSGSIESTNDNNDIIIVKTDSSGNTIWTNIFGGDESDGAFSAHQTVDGGYAICGYNGSHEPAQTDVWLIKTDSNGDSLWSKLYGGHADDQYGGWGLDYGYDMQLADDGGFIITGVNRTDDEGNKQTWLVKTDECGNTKYLISHFQAETTSGEVPFSVNFYDLTTHGLGDLTSWFWDFGDGATSEEQHPSHEYQVGGLYTVSLTVTDSNGLTNTRNKLEYIEAVYSNPESDFSADTTYGNAPLTVHFNDLSQSGSTNIISWQWDFGDNTSSEEQNPTHIYEDSGIYTVSLTVTDECDSTDIMIKQNYILVDGTHITAGNVSGIWAYDNSPYFVDGEITIQQNDELMIESGSTIIFTGHYKFNVYGRLVAQGAIDDTITFTAQDTLTGWDALRFNDTNLNGQDSSKFVYCKLEYGITSDAIWVARSGGILCDNSSDVLIKNCLIQKNSASTAGGGISLYNNSNITIIENVITHNSSGLQSWFPGGGILCNNSNPKISKNKISHNIGWFGGGIYCGESSDAEIINNEIAYNFAMEDGGGITASHSNPIITNNVIYHNTYEWSGGGICLIQASPIITNCTITNNYPDELADYDGGGIRCSFGSNPSLVNCILWNNTQDEVVFLSYGYPNSITLSYTDIEGGSYSIVTNGNGTINWLNGNLDFLPQFVDASNNDYHLADGSLCIDAGDPNELYYDIEDPNNPGYAQYPAMGTITNDMGVYGGPHVIDWPVVGVGDDFVIHTSEVRLLQNHPNPFNPTTTIEFSIQNDSKVELLIFNIKGQKIKTVADNQFTRGLHSVIWNGDDEYGNSVSSGVYYYELSINGRTEAVRKCLLLK